MQAKADQENKYNQSISIQFGINRASNNRAFYGLQFVPPDLSYSHELFDNNVVNVLTRLFMSRLALSFRARILVIEYGKD